jgi:uncharacterized protein YaiL (DUF2058 family)
MSESLKEQLLALGLAREKKGAGRPAKAGNRGSSKRRKKAAGSGVDDSMTEMSLDRAYALRRQQEQAQAEAAQKRKREEVRRRRQLNREIGDIVNRHRLNQPDAEVPRNFMYKGRIRKVYLTAKQTAALNRGELGIAYLSGGYHLLAPEHIEAVRKLSADHVPDLGSDAN